MDDTRFMEQALKLARLGYGRTSPNPMVGAVVVKDGKVVGKGYHNKAGEPHAEVNALKDAGKLATGGTLYVNLEPCCFQGRTPPCTSAIIEAGVSQVFCSLKDPNPLVSGKGIESLRRAGVEVREGLLAEEAGRLNEAYLKFISTRTPFVLLKVASTLDGRIAAPNGSSRWISSEESRSYVHQLRNGVDAVMVGAGTVLKDDPQLTVRLVKKVKDPKRIVLDTELRVPLEAKVFKDGGATIIATKRDSDLEKRRLLEDQGVEVWTVAQDSQGRVDIGKVVSEAGREEITSIMIEGGSQVYSSALRAGVVDKVAIFLSPKILGEGTPSFSFLGIRGMDEALGLKELDVKRLGEDLLLQAYL